MSQESEPLTFMAVHAHPDDESIGTGGTFARYAAEGLRTVLVTCTRGEEGEIHDPALDAVMDQPRLGQIREGELRAATSALGIGALYLLPYRDSGMAGTPANANVAAFVNADAIEAADRLAAIIRAARPQVVATYDPRGGYGHPDHLMAHRITTLAVERAAQDGPVEIRKIGETAETEGDAGTTGTGTGWQVQKLYYTAVPLSTLLWVNDRMRTRGLEPPFDVEDQTFDLRQYAAPDEAITARVSVRGYLEQARRARRAHRTQLSDDDVLLSLPTDIAERAFGEECYIRAWTRVDAPTWEDDLFAGLRPGR